MFRELERTLADKSVAIRVLEHAYTLSYFSICINMNLEHAPKKFLECAGTKERTHTYTYMTDQTKSTVFKERK